VPHPKQVDSILSSPPMHWVGDGFPVRSVFSPPSVGDRLSPFVLMDYAGPEAFAPSETPRGVGAHPHRGFETVTVVYQGELEHRDSAGASGVIGPGDVQWMTAASGVLHEEKHSREFTRRGGSLEMAQLWVNLPAAHKMAPPRYQDLRREAIPSAALPDGAGTARIIAGAFDGVAGAARTCTRVILWDVSLREGAEVRLPIRDGHNAAVFVRRGSVRVGGTHDAGPRQLAILHPAGDGVIVEADAASELLIVGGEPIDEPVVARGPFVMNTPEQIEEAFADVRAGRFGSL